VQGRQKLIRFFLALKSIDPNSKRLGIYPLSFCFPKKKAPKKKGTLNMLPIALSGRARI